MYAFNKRELSQVLHEELSIMGFEHAIWYPIRGWRLPRDRIVRLLREASFVWQRKPALNKVGSNPLNASEKNFFSNWLLSSRNRRGRKLLRFRQPRRTVLYEAEAGPRLRQSGGDEFQKQRQLFGLVMRLARRPMFESERLHTLKLS